MTGDAQPEARKGFPQRFTWILAAATALLSLGALLWQGIDFFVGVALGGRWAWKHRSQIWQQAQRLSDGTATRAKDTARSSWERARRIVIRRHEESSLLPTDSETQANATECPEPPAAIRQ